MTPRTALFGGLIALVAVLSLVAARQRPRLPTIDHDPIVRISPDTDPDVIAGPPKVKLAVLIVFDQFRGDYLGRWKQHFAADGFRRIMDHGCWFSNCYFPYATTTTGPGHAALLTGTNPDRNGITNNEWYDRDLGRLVYCASSSRYDPVHNGTTVNSRRNRAGGGTPEFILSPSVGDNLKAAGRGGKVIGLGIKDRAAMFPAGRHADAAYWFAGDFITSTYYQDALPGWARAFNDSKLRDQWYGRTWDRLRLDLDYEKVIGPDNGPGEADRYGLGRTFPHPITGGKPTFSSVYHDALITSPFGNDLLFEFTKACIDGEKLGQRGEADLLTVSFSSFDLVGHAYGPDSQELFDTMLRADRGMADLLAFLDQRVGQRQYAILVTGDHGVTPLPEVSRSKGIDANRVTQAVLHAGADKFLSDTFGKPLKSAGESDSPQAGRKSQWIEAFPSPWIYLNEQQIARRGLDKDVVAEALANWLRHKPEMARVYTRNDLELPARDQIDRLVRASFYPMRSGDLYLVLKPHHMFTAPLSSGTWHGAPYDYDRHVGFAILGPGLPRGEQSEAIVPQQAAPLMAGFLGLKPPKECEYPLPMSLR